jgi:hypothetical protein
MVECILFPDQIKHLKKVDLWPSEFQESGTIETSKSEINDKKQVVEDGDEESDDDLMLEHNPNHVVVDDSD